mgnify:CR=1 FL=1
MRFIRLFTQDGESRFEELDAAFAPADFAPPAPPLDLTTPLPAQAVMLMRAHAGWSDDAHPAPARTLQLCLSGKWELTAGGETITAVPGDILLTEDTTGAGHGSRCLEDSLVAIVRLDDPTPDA